MKNRELKAVRDLFENDNLVLMQAAYENGEELSLGLKDESGDIFKIFSFSAMA